MVEQCKDAPPKPGERRYANIDRSDLGTFLFKWEAQGWRLVTARTHTVTLPPDGAKFRRVAISMEYAPHD